MLLAILTIFFLTLLSGTAVSDFPSLQPQDLSVSHPSLTPSVNTNSKWDDEDLYIFFLCLILFLTSALMCAPTFTLVFKANLAAYFDVIVVQQILKNYPNLVASKRSGEHDRYNRVQS